MSLERIEVKRENVDCDERRTDIETKCLPAHLPLHPLNPCLEKLTRKRCHAKLVADIGVALDWKIKMDARKHLFGPRKLSSWST